MKPGFLSDYFTGIACKRLSAVEADPNSSNQHEFDGVAKLKRLLGTEKQTFDTVFIYLEDKDQDCCTDKGFVTWYDARKKHPTRSEHRLYYNTNDAMSLAATEDLLIIGKRPDNTLMVLVAKTGSTYENQLFWLFGLHEELVSFDIKQISSDADMQLNLAAKFILSELGIEVETEDVSWLDIVLQKFTDFPSTSEFSAFARSTFIDVPLFEDPDTAVMKWLDHEEMLFRTLEKYLVERRLETGFQNVDEFISYSLGILNRRKSRAGWALEHHLDFIFTHHNLMYSKGKETENRARPDFLFPGVDCYRNPSFPSSLLSMLGVKTSCKDRWRQVLSEAARIERKNLFTIEPGISIHQTAEMRANSLKLVVPRQIHTTYTSKQQSWLMSLSDFIVSIKEQQQKAEQQKPFNGA